MVVAVAAAAAAVGTTVVVASVLVASWFVVQRVVSVVGGSTATVVLAAVVGAAGGVGGGVGVACTAHFSRQIVPSLQCVANDLSDIVFNGCGARVDARKERGTTVSDACPIVHVVQWW